MGAIAVIRQRGQITIPGSLREDCDWLNIGNVIEFEKENEVVVIKPKIAMNKKVFDWDKFERKIAIARLFKGERGNLSAMVAEDRKNH